MTTGFSLLGDTTAVSQVPTMLASLSGQLIYFESKLAVTWKGLPHFTYLKSNKSNPRTGALASQKHPTLAHALLSHVRVAVPVIATIYHGPI